MWHQTALSCIGSSDPQPILYFETEDLIPQSWKICGLSAIKYFPEWTITPSSSRKAFTAVDNYSHKEKECLAKKPEPQFLKHLTLYRSSLPLLDLVSCSVSEAGVDLRPLEQWHLGIQMINLQENETETGLIIESLVTLDTTPRDFSASVVGA